LGLEQLQLLLGQQALGAGRLQLVAQEHHIGLGQDHLLDEVGTLLGESNAELFLLAQGLLQSPQLLLARRDRLLPQIEVLACCRHYGRAGVAPLLLLAELQVEDLDDVLLPCAGALEGDARVGLRPLDIGRVELGEDKEAENPEVRDDDEDCAVHTISCSRSSSSRRRAGRT